MNTVLVLGASGFLGASVKGLLDEHPVLGDGVYVARRLPAPGTPGLDRWLPFDVVHASAREIRALLALVRPDAVVNCVGTASTTASDLRTTNVLVPDKLVQALEEYGAARLVHVGSASEYGVQEAGMPIPETARCQPVGDLGVTKLDGTEAVCSATEEGRIHAIALRVFDPIGAGSPLTSTAGRAAATIRDAIVAGEQVVDFGPLTTYRDYIDVRDVAWAILIAAATNVNEATVFNVGRGEAVLTRSLVSELAALAGFEGAIRESRVRPSRPSHVFWQQADITAVRARLGWSPRYGLHDALESLWRSVWPPQHH
ncbi:MAG TPA: NAD(P)-dependent oxidoreductase [Acidimicrobiales bacterium]|jgi:nucleoside-diphosphate-sugar epimerase